MPWNFGVGEVCSTAPLHPCRAATCAAVQRDSWQAHRALASPAVCADVGLPHGAFIRRGERPLGTIAAKIGSAKARGDVVPAITDRVGAPYSSLGEQSVKPSSPAFSFPRPILDEDEVVAATSKWVRKKRRSRPLRPPKPFVTPGPGAYDPYASDPKPRRSAHAERTDISRNCAHRALAFALDDARTYHAPQAVLRLSVH